MIVKDEDAVKRLNSPMNLINRLRASSSKDKKNNAMSLFGIGRSADKKQQESDSSKPQPPSFNPFSSESSSTPTGLIPSERLAEPNLDSLLEDHESKIKLGLAHDRAIDLLNRSVQLLTDKLDDVRADKLPSVISAASKTVEGIRRERNEAAKNGKDREVHYHFYTPAQKKISDYEVIDVA